MVLITGTVVNSTSTVVSGGSAVVNSCRIEVSSGIKVVKTEKGNGRTVAAVTI
jgi:hypothetical protein